MKMTFAMPAALAARPKKPKIAEIKVQHHARQFGQSKYGLSRIYKVLLDLMVIKTVASFTARPMLWFGMLSVPMLLAATVAFATTIVTLVSDGTYSLPIAGSRVLIKLDLQGAELKALEGMGDLWDRCAGLLLEVSIGVNGTLEPLREILARFGFYEYSTTNELEVNGRVVEADKLWLRRDGG